MRNDHESEEERSERLSSEVLIHIGDCLYFGRCGRIDRTGAMAWYMKAAEVGDPNAQMKIAWGYLNGEGVRQSDAKAAEWFREE